jgi:HSP20 family protein
MTKTFKKFWTFENLNLEFVSNFDIRISDLRNMPIIPRRPFWDIEKWFDEEWPDLPQRLGRRLRMPRLPSLRAPRMDIYEKGANIVAEVELPGVDPKNIDVEVQNNVLKIEAKRKEKKEEKGKGYYRKEISSGFYKRMVPLPAEVFSGKAKAEYADGILKVEIPKKQARKVKKEEGVKIKVKTA